MAHAEDIHDGHGDDTSQDDEFNASIITGVTKARWKGRAEQESQLIHRVVDETLDKLADRPEMTLQAVYSRVLAELQIAVHIENVWRTPLKGKALDDLTEEQRAFNEMKHSLPQITKPRMLSEVAVVKLLLAREHIVAINLSGGPGENDTAALGLYINRGADEGIYSTNEALLYNMVASLEQAYSHNTQESILKMLKNLAPLVLKTIDKRYIPMANGVFDHENKELLPFSPEFVFLTKSPIRYNPDATNPQIIQPDGTPWDVESWIEDLSDDEGVPELLWEIISAALRQGERFDKAVFFHSRQGNNGKGTFCAMLRNILGAAGTTSVPMDKFSKPFALAGLVHAQAIITDENPVGAFSKDLGDFKAIVTGDQFTLERKYRDPFSVSFNGLVVQCVNDFPKSRDKSASYARRQLFIPFRKWFGGDGVERKYIKQDYLARDEVLEYVVLKALHMDHTEFSEPDACRALLEQFQRENNPVVDFWQEFADEFVWDMLPTGFLYDLFVSWFRKNHPSGTVVNRNEFLNHLTELLSGDPVWDATDITTKRRPGAKMDQIEFLIRDYDLDQWQTPGYSGKDPKFKYVPPPRQNYRAIVRKDVTTTTTVPAAVARTMNDKDA